MVANQDIELILSDLNSFLNFTWTDAERSAKIRNYCFSSMQYLEEVSGVTLDFETDYLARDLLFNRVLYMDSQALSDFNENYAGMLYELKIKYTDED